MVTESSDILEEFSFYYKKKSSKNIDHLSELQKSLYEKLQEEPLSSEAIFESFSVSPAILSAEISMMELQKVLQKNKEGKYEIF